MRKLLAGIIVALLGLIVYLNWFAPLRLPEGKVLVSQGYLDSLYAIAIPDTVELTDTIWLKPDTVRIEKESPIPKPDGEVLAYTDSLATPDLTVWVWDRIRLNGTFESREWAYRLNTPYYVTREITITQPVPMPYPVLTDNSRTYKFYGQVGYDFMQGSLVGGGGIVRGRWMLGLEGGRNQFEVKTGVLF